MNPYDYVYAYKCPHCGRAAFMLNRIPGPDEHVSADGVMLIDGTEPDPNDSIRCGSCGDVNITPLNLHNVVSACAAGPDISGRFCGSIVEKHGDMCPSCESDALRSEHEQA